MKNHNLSWLILILLGGVIALSVQVKAATANGLKQLPDALPPMHLQYQVQTPVPIEATPTDVDNSSRVLPSVGSNALLVLGATILVLIIIIGVIISSRWRAKH